MNLSNLHHPATARRSGFTLIELLVVIAIIAILAAILFPVFAQAKLAAKKTQSLSNIKQLALGVTMYMTDSDDVIPMSEVGSGDTYTSWAAMVYPYLKTGQNLVNVIGTIQNNASMGIFRSPANPFPETKDRNPGEYSYGVHMSLFVTNYYESWAGYPGIDTPANPGVQMSVVDQTADKVMLMEKGANSPDNNWNYPWFHDWQQMWIGPICNTEGDPNTVYRDGVESYTPGTTVYHPMFDNDCPTSWSGGWECAAHPRYRFARVAPMAFMDGHAKGIQKGGIKWFQNIWIDRRNINRYSWYYGYLNDAGWGFPGIH